jgi:hypothetical protein
LNLDISFGEEGAWAGATAARSLLGRTVTISKVREEFFRHRLPFDRSSMTHWRNRMGAERLLALSQESFTDDDLISSPRVRTVKITAAGGRRSKVGRTVRRATVLL